MTDVVVLFVVLWCIYASDSLWWTNERSLLLTGARLGGFAIQYGPKLVVKNGNGFFTPPLLPPFKISFEITLPAHVTGEPAKGSSSATEHVVAKALDLAWPLHRLGAGLWVYLFVVAPAVVVWFGFVSSWLWLLLALVVWLTAILVTYRQSWRALHPERRREWRSAAALILLSPPGAIRAGDRLTRTALNGLDALRTIQILASEADFHRVVRLIHFDPAFAGTDVARQLEELLGRDGLARVLGAVPAREAGMKGFCPRCHGQVLRPGGDCPDCLEMAIRAFAVS